MEACKILLWAISGAEYTEVPKSLLKCPCLQVPHPESSPLATAQSCHLKWSLYLLHLEACLSPQWRLVVPDCHTGMLCGHDYISILVPSLAL